MSGTSNQACPPRKAKTAQGPKSKNIVDVDKLKKSNNAGEPGVEKENVKFLFGLLEQASNEREKLMKDLAEKSELIELISQQRDLEEASFRKVLTSERKKFDKQMVDARNMLQRREDLLRGWSKAGVMKLSSVSDASNEYSEVIGLLKKTCRLVPDAIEESEKKQLKISAISSKKKENNDDDNDDDDDDDDYDDEFEENENEKVVGASNENNESNTLSSSILMGDSSRKKKAERDDSDDKCKDVDKDYYADGKGKEEISLKQPGVTSISISDLAAQEGSNEIFAEIDEQRSTKAIKKNEPDKRNSKEKRPPKKVKGTKGKGSVASSSQSDIHKESPLQSRRQRNKDKKMESASVDTSSSKRYWWDHLVDDSNEEIKDASIVSSLMLGSGLDGAGKDKRKKGPEENNAIENESNAPVDGGGSVMSLRSEDLNFTISTT